MRRFAARLPRRFPRRFASNSASSSSSPSWSYLTTGVGLGAAGLATSFALLTPPAASVMAEEGEFTLDEVRAHATLETGIWVVHDGNVYDVTAFIAEHPGGSAKIMLAAGGSVEPFWKVYKQHDAPAVRTKLASMRIGALAKADASSLSAALAKDTSDPYCNEPTRHPALRVTKEQPFNAETPVELIADNWITPNELWYCRHHHPVPVVDPATFELVVTVDEPLRPALAFERGAKAASELRLSLDDIKTRFPKRLVTTTLQCAGNRRGELSEHGKTSGLQWTAGTLSTATFGGVYLRDLLAEGLTISEQTARRIGVEHVQFRGIDAPYDASVPVHKALSAEGDVLLAYEMNGEELPREHGYPLRIIIPGVVGARNVKWVDRIVISNEVAHSAWQRNVQYRGYSPNVKNFKGVEPTIAAAVYELPVQSAICEPASGTKVYEEDGEAEVEVKGYAYSGGGRGITRVDVSADGGKTWTTATLGKGSHQAMHKAWAWTLWTASVPLPKTTVETSEKTGGETAANENKVKIVCKAVDASYNSQPEQTAPIWNLRGILNNAWHGVEVEVVKEE